MLGNRGLPELAPMVRHAEERWDGFGGPDGLKARAIPFGARVIAACNAWDRLRHGDPFREGLELPAAVAALLALRGSQLDPDVTGALTDLVVLKEAGRDVDR
jgi:HD-GYP domain-containing protein (c-di-GMP phosphodiesterase class II)